MPGKLLYFLILAFFISCSEIKTQNQMHTDAAMSLTPAHHNLNLRLDTIKTEKFWALMDEAIQFAKGADQLKENFLVSELADLPPEDIQDFEIAFRKLMIEANDYKIMGAQKIIQGYVSDDTYLYFRCWLISQGQEVYNEVLKNPDFMANRISKGDICEFESLMYVATKAYSKKTGKEEDNTFPRQIAANLGLEYEFGTPPTKGIDWKAEDLPVLFPKLWERMK